MDDKNKSNRTDKSDSSQLLLDIESLSVQYQSSRGAVRALRDIDLELHEGEILGVAGESGSGKSTLALAILQYLGENGEVTKGSITFDGRSMRELSERELRGIRGNEIAHVPQDPKTSLNPSMTVGKQIQETIKLHQETSNKEAWERTYEILEEVNISDPKYNAERYPHELSGGMQQRILLAMALSCDPQLLILDEPTTGLDVTTQAKILDLIDELIDSYGTTVLLITHNLGVISQSTDRVLIIYAGTTMERGPTSDVFSNPSNPYTQGLLASLPSATEQKQLEPIPGNIPDLTTVPEGCIFADRCQFAEQECRTTHIKEETVKNNPTQSTRCRRWETAVENPIKPKTATEESKSSSTGSEQLIRTENVRKYFGEQSLLDRFTGGYRPVKAVDGVDIDIHDSEILGLVGESGCGKSTLGRSLLRLHELNDGVIEYNGRDITDLHGEDLREFRSDAQIVFQNPHSSLNPQKKIKKILGRPLKLFTDLDNAEREEKMIDLLEQVELGSEYVSRYPHELSGGEKQRVAIARAFSADPNFIVLDEPVSGLDVSVQASLLKLLSTLRKDYNSSFLFISHDLSVVNYISDRIAVMYLGHIVEIGSNESIFEPPYHPYTQVLLSSNPSIESDQQDERVHLEGDVPSARDPPTGCPFHTRCPHKIGEICETEFPDLERVENSNDASHRIGCHLEEDEMMNL